jgi:hypothetical protein
MRFTKNSRIFWGPVSIVFPHFHLKWNRPSSEKGNDCGSSVPSFSDAINQLLKFVPLAGWNYCTFTSYEQHSRNFVAVLVGTKRQVVGKFSCPATYHEGACGEISFSQSRTPCFNFLTQYRNRSSEFKDCAVYSNRTITTMEFVLKFSATCTSWIMFYLNVTDDEMLYNYPILSINLHLT